MQLTEHFNNKSVLSQLIQQLSLSRGVGAVIREIEEAAMFRQRVHNNIFDSDYGFFGELVNIHIDFRTQILTIQYRYAKNQFNIRNIHELGAYIGNWLKDNLASDIYPWAWYLQKEVERNDSSSAANA